ncbi:hypothetical protein BpHYR1_013135 [Brachionus plicatilis]|uniref:Uncharacterized protein n=1 Tax=Brachionus plicatilis TaxID=10195 RepID=A0A3M7Q8V6_BRAPC|nr:hypothetical protein BpHYR1_013135 [Brachionus plicatilis]
MATARLACGGGLLGGHLCSLHITHKNILQKEKTLQQANNLDLLRWETVGSHLCNKNQSTPLTLATEH